MSPEGHGSDIAKAVAIAALSAMATAFITWGVDVLKEKTKRQDPSHGGERSKKQK